MSDAPTADLSVTSVEQDGRILSGVGVTPEALEKTMERHAPETPAEPTESAPATSSEPTQKQTRGAKRFDQLTGEREEQRRRADAAERERDALRAQLAQQSRAAAEPAGPSPQREREAVAAPSETFTFPSFDEWVAKNPDKSWDDWSDAKHDARTDWKLSRGAYVSQADFDARLRDRIEADRASRALGEQANTVFAAARQASPTFDADFRTLIASEPKLSLDAASDRRRLEFILQSPHAPSVLVALVSKPHLIPMLAQMDDFEFTRAVDALAPASPVAPAASTAMRSPVDVPAPYQPVGSGSKTTVASSADLIKKGGYDFDKSGYREKRAAELGRTRRAK